MSSITPKRKPWFSGSGKRKKKFSWIVCDNIPTNPSNFCLPVLLNANEIMVSTDKERSPFDKRNIPGIYVYNIHFNSWRLFINYPHNYYASFHTMSYDKEKSQINLYDGQNSSITQIVFDPNKVFNSDPIIKYFQFLYLGRDANAIFVNSQHHVIGGSHSKSHICFKIPEKDLQFIKLFNNWEQGLHRFGLVYIKSLNSLLMLGGFDKGFTNCINQYSIKDKIWKTFELNPNSLSMPNKSSFGCVVAQNGKYVIIFGGTTDGHNIQTNHGWRLNYLDDIHILDIKKKIIIKSKHKCPEMAGYHAVIIETKDMLINGYIRYIMNVYNLNIPIEMIALIDFYCVSTNYVHVFQRHGGKHWKMRIDVLLNEVLNPKRIQNMSSINQKVLKRILLL